LVAVALACSGKPKAVATEPADAALEAEADAVDPEAELDEGSGPEVPIITPFGVPECDAYVKRYLDCVETKTSGEPKARLLRAFEMNRTKWRTLATMREGALALGVACRAAEQKAKEELSVDYGCEF
jgi:hypothetical protein